jgi:hypothetical protein
MLWTYVAVVVQTLLEGRIERPLPPSIPHYHHCKMPDPQSFYFNALNGTQVIISPEDRHLAEERPWRISSSGYVVSSSRKEGKYKLYYLHKLIKGSSARHVNSNRLDNRRSNLVATSNRKRSFDMSQEEIEIRTVAPLLDHTMVPQECPRDADHVTVKYGYGKIYRGAFANHKPHGHGELYEEDKSSVGLWKDGILIWGVVIVFKKLPTWMEVPREARQIELIYPIRLNA